MNGQDIIAKLRANEAELRKRGVRHAALFGSGARGIPPQAAANCPGSISKGLAPQRFRNRGTLHDLVNILDGGHDIRKAGRLDALSHQKT